MSNWTQAICDACWEKRHPERQPHRTTDVDLELCSYCGDITMSGIYVREDPKTVPFPRELPYKDYERD